ncbi:hypothetical protein JXA88_16800 [Candidatus Fermentibacteria bacterium]|nr:hypothetical protein [Candidatus Fermentibacteria bacterium]
MNTHLVVLTDENGFFGQTRKPWVSLDIGKVCRAVEQSGIPVRRFTFQDVGANAVDIRDSAVFYAFSQKENTRRYITDIVRHLSHGSNLLIPSYDLLLCHENKGYQELFRRQQGMPVLPSAYFVSGAGAEAMDIAFPVVVKTVDGSNGKGVFLAHTRAELRRIVRRMEPRMPLCTRIDLIRRRFFRRKKTYPEYPDYSNRTDYLQYREYVRLRKRFIVQEFVDGYSYDYRVLVIGDRYFVMRRGAFPGDFRASGTKMFDFDFQIPDGLLEFARSVYEKALAPLMSMDICPRDDGFVLFEFQALHFGTSALKKARGWYVRQGGSWRFLEGKADLEHCMGEALVGYLRTHGIASA